MHLFKSDGQDDADQAGPGGPHVQAVPEPEVGPDRLGVAEDLAVVTGDELCHGQLVPTGSIADVALGVAKSSPNQVEPGTVGLRVVLDVVVVEVQVAQTQKHEPDDADDRADDEPAVHRVQGLVAGAFGPARTL